MEKDPILNPIQKEAARKIGNPTSIFALRLADEVILLASESQDVPPISLALANVPNLSTDKSCLSQSSKL